MTKENKYCDNVSKTWIIKSNGKEIKPIFISSKNALRDKYPELNFQEDEKEFIVQFENSSDLVASRDTGKEVECFITNLNRTKRIKGTIKHEKQKV